MYTVSTKFGIGEVISNDGKMLEVYYPEVDKTFKTLLAYSPKVYKTREIAEAILEGKEEAIAIAGAKREEEDAEIMKAGFAAQRRLEEINIEASKKLMKNI